MSLKIEQKLDCSLAIRSKPRVFTTGAFLVPMEIVRDGTKRYVWVVDQLTDDTYDEDGVLCSLSLLADNEENLIQT